MDIVEQAIKSMDIGLVYYEHSGCNITVFSSDKMKAELTKMIPGYQVTDPNTGEVGTVVSDKFIVCGNYCVRVNFPSGEDVYDCDFFIEEEKEYINLHIMLEKIVEEFDSPTDREVEAVDVIMPLNDFRKIEDKLSLKNKYIQFIPGFFSTILEMEALKPYIKLFNHPTITKWYEDKKINKYEICIFKYNPDNIPITLYISLMEKVEEWLTPEIEGVEVMILPKDFKEIEKKLSLEKEYQHLIEDHISASVEMKALQPYIKLFNHPTINKWYQENKNNMNKYEICISKPETENI